ncbi:hypothetical protein COU57_00095 [Candidatus Pacearchaeota archaeon CG10_big_fil_rev_8_21_14_0_10_32_14]|nr:MAG: hypothetical protein COU57_00095 [Candidatus Pacearchaeota archaeon CG10_big_fil_rev_8_21_14_0_10_32_14]
MAYRLWVAGDGDLECEYISTIRNTLIQDSIKNDRPFYFINRTDTPGKVKAYEMLLESSEGRKFNNASKAYDLALELEDEERTQSAREIMISLSPKNSLYYFSGRHGHVADQVGVDAVLTLLSEQQGVDKTHLRRLVDKYSS